MNVNVPHEWLSPERARVVSEGADLAQGLIDAAFPPHPDDPEGALATQQVEQQLKIASQQRMKDAPGNERLWWTQGVALGFCAAAANGLVAASEHTEDTPLEHLHKLNRRVLAAAPAEKIEAVKDVQRLVEHVLEHDTVGIAWALEVIFVPAQHVSRDTVGSRLRTVLTDALLTATIAARMAAALQAQE